LTKGIRIIGERFEAGEVFLSEFIMADQAMKKVLAILEPALPKKSARKDFR